MSAWLLPDYIADALPAEAHHIEALRRRLLDTARGYGYELVIPPLIEYLESLLTGSGEGLEPQTFKLIDQISGKTLGVRADTTPQVARIDTHLLGHRGVTRLCYCGPVLHTHPERAQATRELLQLGAEIYGEPSRQADLEIATLALDCLRRARVPGCVIDLGDARIVPLLLQGTRLLDAELAALHRALVAKDRGAVAAASADLPMDVQGQLLLLTELYGDATVLDEAQRAFAGVAGTQQVFDDLRWFAGHLAEQGAQVSVDLADARGWGYYTGMRFAVYAPHVQDALLRGGRYDGVGAAFGARARVRRAAAGFTLELKRLAEAADGLTVRGAIRAPWSDSRALDAAVARLREQGEIVVRMGEDYPAEADSLHFDRTLVHDAAAGWHVVALDRAA